MADKINENNFKQVLFYYLDEKYKDRLAEFTGRYYKEFQDYDEELDEEFRFKDFIDWFMLELKNMLKTTQT